MDSKELFKKIKNNQIMFNDALKKQKLFLDELNNVKICKKTSKQKKIITNLENFYMSREEVFNFFKDYAKMYIDAGYKVKKDKIKGTGLIILTPKQMIQRLPIALAQVKADNDSESLLNEIMQTVYSLYQSKGITKKVCNNIIKSVN